MVLCHAGRSQETWVFEQVTYSLLVIKMGVITILHVGIKRIKRENASEAP